MAEVSTFVRGGKAFLKDAAGNLTTHDPSKVADRVLSGRYSPATAEDVQARDAEKTSGVGALAESAAAGAYDAAVAPVTALGAVYSAATGNEDPTAPLSGRALMRELAYLGGEATGEDGRATAQQYERDARLRAEGHPVLSAIGNIGGSIAGGLGVAGGAKSLGARAGKALGSGLAAGAVAGAAEGAALGGVAAREEAFIKDEDLTAESVLAGMGWGALIGGGVGLASVAAPKLFNRVRSRGETPVDAPVQIASSKLERPMEESAERILGQPAAPGLGEKLRDAVEGAQSVAAGADRETLRQYGAFRWDSTARRGRALWRNRDQILEGATSDLTAQVDNLVQQSRVVTNEVADSGLKRSHIASKLSSNPEAQLAAARAEAARLVDVVETIGQRTDELGNVPLAKRLYQYVGEHAKTIAATADPAEAFIALDKTKRGLQRWAQSLRESGRMSTDALKRQQSFALGDELAALQEGTRQVLMDEGVWGAAAGDQRAINAAWEKFFESNRMFDGHFVTRTGVEFDGRPIIAADPRKVASYVRGLGKAESALVDQHFRAHVQALDELTSSIGKAFDLGERAAAVKSVQESAKRVGRTLAAADETVKVANQIDAVIEAERGGSFSTLSGLFGGGIVGGAPGAALGLGAGVVARPGQMMRQAAALDVLASNLDGKIGRSIGNFFKRANDRVHIPRGLPSRRVSTPATTATALEVFQGREDNAVSAYRKKVAQLDDMTRDYGAGMRQQTQQALGQELPTRAPKLAGKVADTATRAAIFLQSKRPEPDRNLASLTPNASRPVPSDYEISKFARYWNTVANPISAVRDLENGTLTHEQVEAIQVVYPRLYRRIQEHVMERLREADSKGIEVPYQAKLQLDLLLNLNGAGEPTATPDFMLRFTEMQTAVAEQQAAAPAPQPVKMSGRYASARNDLEREL